MLQTSWERRTSHETETIWRRIIQRHREAQSMARCGEVGQAKALLEEALPPLIKAWSQHSGLPRNLQILRLRKLLRGDLSAVLKPRAAAQVAHNPKTAAAVKNTSKRIPLHDITQMIDAVRLAQAEEHFHAIAS